MLYCRRLVGSLALPHLKYNDSAAQITPLVSLHATVEMPICSLNAHHSWCLIFFGLCLVSTPQSVSPPCCTLCSCGTRKVLQWTAFLPPASFWPLEHPPNLFPLMITPWPLDGGRSKVLNISTNFLCWIATANDEHHVHSLHRHHEGPPKHLTPSENRR